MHKPKIILLDFRYKNGNWVTVDAKASERQKVSNAARTWQHIFNCIGLKFIQHTKYNFSKHVSSERVK